MSTTTSYGLLTIIPLANEQTCGLSGWFHPEEKISCQKLDPPENSEPNEQVEHEKSISHLLAVAFAPARHMRFKVRSDGIPFCDLHDVRLASFSRRS
jgi:hypothetical protein